MTLPLEIEGTESREVGQQLSRMVVMLEEEEKGRGRPVLWTCRHGQEEKAL
jgi:hypothetical protein